MKHWHEERTMDDSPVSRAIYGDVAWAAGYNACVETFKRDCPGEAKFLTEHLCDDCGATPSECEAVMRRIGEACCVSCGVSDTHGMNLDDWAKLRFENAMK